MFPERPGLPPFVELSTSTTKSTHIEIASKRRQTGPLASKEENSSFFKQSGSMNGLSRLQPQAGDTEDHNDLPHSYFPCLDSRPGQNRAWQSNEVPFKDAVRVQSFCREHHVSALSFFQAAWAMVLRCYLGSPSVCFTSNSSNRAEIANSATVSVCQMEFAETTSMLDVLKAVHTKYLSSPSSQPWQIQACIHEQPNIPNILPMNTSLVYREDSRSMMDTLAIPEHALRDLNKV